MNISHYNIKWTKFCELSQEADDIWFITLCTPF